MWIIMIFRYAPRVFLGGVLLVLLSACGMAEGTAARPGNPGIVGSQRRGGMASGYYTVEASSFDEFGWKEYITAYIDNNRIVTVEYDAKNASGFIKSWDMDYMLQMNAIKGNYPAKYTRYYSTALLNRQNPERIDVLSGATVSFYSFKALAAAVIQQAWAGDKKVALVDTSK
jgi:major membrane immunogen (membrane-anchored lipoprotein)